jgi:hypothetical protein
MQLRSEPLRGLDGCKWRRETVSVYSATRGASCIIYHFDFSDNKEGWPEILNLWCYLSQSLAGILGNYFNTSGTQ